MKSETNVCWVCLSSSHQQNPLYGNIKSVYYQNILGRELELSEQKSINICVDCEALLNKFIKFRDKVKKSFQHLHCNEEILPEQAPRLKIVNQYKISISQDGTWTDYLNSITKPINELTTANNAVNDLPLKLDTEVKYMPVTKIKKHSKNKEEVIGILEKDSFVGLEEWQDYDNKKCREKSQGLKVDYRFKITIDDDDTWNDLPDTKTILPDEFTVNELPRSPINSDTSDYEPTILKKERKGRTKNKNNVFIKKRLSKKQLIKERNALLNEEGYVNAILKCDNCIVTFASQDDLQEHVTKKHNKAHPHKCAICNRRFIHEATYNHHINRHTTRYFCVACNGRFISKYSVTRHYFTEHCRNNIAQDTLLKDTIRQEPDLETLSFTNTSTLQNHIKTSTQHQVNLKLKKLQAESKTVNIDEVKASLAKPLHRCRVCDRTFQFKGNLSRHMKSHIAKANGELSCVPCGRVFASHATFQQHMKLSKRHAGNVNLKANGEISCVPCGRVFESHEEFQQHINSCKRHVGNIKFKFICSDCGAEFTSKTKLTDHINWEHMKKYEHVCGVCKKVFKTNTSLYVHQFVHIKKQHLCDHCGKEYKRSSMLQAHIQASHRGAPAARAECSRQAALRRHERRVYSGVDVSIVGLTCQ